MYALCLMKPCSRWQSHDSHMTVILAPPLPTDIKVVSIDVVGPLHSLHWCQLHTAVLICQRGGEEWFRNWKGGVATQTSCLQGMILVYLFFGALTVEEAASVEYVCSSGTTTPSYSWMKWKLESACNTVIRD